jgi:hypothetical protein
MSADRVDRKPLGERALVIVPTFDHGPLLRYSVASALAQHWAAVEVVVVCDGAPDSTRALIEHMMSDDPRLSYQWFAKGERTGELHRNTVIEQASSDFVCYLSDDDLWSPEHLAAMHRALEHGDIAHANHLFIDTDGRYHGVVVDLDDPTVRAAHLDGASFLSLSTIGHTMAAWHEKGLRWRVTPPGRHTDWYFLTGALELGLRERATGSVTVLNVPSSHRREWSIGRRESELADLAARSADGWDQLVADTLLAQLAFTTARGIEHETWAQNMSRRYDDDTARLQELVGAAHTEIESAHAERYEAIAQSSHARDEWVRVAAELRCEMDRVELLERELAEVRHDLDVLHGTKMVRLQQRLARSALVRRLARAGR